MKRTSSMTYHETDESRELELYTTNNGGLYRQMITPIINSLRKKYQRGTYDADKAVDLWYNVATEGAKLYNKEFGSDSQWTACLTSNAAILWRSTLRATIKRR